MTTEDLRVRELVDPPDGYAIAYEVGDLPTGNVVVAYEEGAEDHASGADARERAGRYLFEPPPRPFLAVDKYGNVTPHF